jgi:hypothetical protein
MTTRASQIAARFDAFMNSPARKTLVYAALVGISLAIAESIWWDWMLHHVWRPVLANIRWAAMQPMRVGATIAFVCLVACILAAFVDTSPAAAVLGRWVRAIVNPEVASAECSSIKSELVEVRDAIRYGPARLKHLGSLNRAEMDALHRDVLDVKNALNQARNAQVRMLLVTLQQMKDLGGHTFANYTAIEYEQNNLPMYIRIFERFDQQTHHKVDCREALAAACESYDRNQEQLYTFSRCLGVSIEPLDPYKLWQEGDAAYRRILKQKTEASYLAAIKEFLYPAVVS